MRMNPRLFIPFSPPTYLISRSTIFCASFRNIIGINCISLIITKRINCSGIFYIFSRALDTRFCA